MKIIATCLALLFAAPALAQDAISDVIADQLRDFAAGDVDGAFDHASPGIRGLFGSAERFGAMVQQGYPMVWRHRSFRMGERRDIAGALWQRVEVIDSDGRTHLLDYKMEPGPAGWKIDAVQLLPAPVPSV